MASGNFVGLGVPKKETEATSEKATEKPAATAPSGLTGLTSLGGAGGLKGLGGAAGGSGGSGGLTGLGGGGGLTGLGGGGLTGLGGLGGAKKKEPAPAPAPKGRGGIGIDTSAADRIKHLLGQRGTPDAGLRIRIRGGGCTGLQYDMEFADTERERDRVFEDHGVRLFVDPKSYIFLIGTTLTYQTGLLESGFKLENPNVKKSCGCGESFSI